MRSKLFSKFGLFLKVEFGKLDFKKESNLLNNFERMPRA